MSNTQKNKKQPKLLQGNTLDLIKTFKDEEFELIVSDIPYGIDFDEWDILHSNKNSALGGASEAQKDKVAFKRRGKPLNGWSKEDRKRSKEYQEWCESWAVDWLRVLKPGASCFIFAGRQQQHSVIEAMENAGFTLRDVLSWEKDSAFHRAQRLSKVFERRGDTKNKEKFIGWRLGNLRPLHEPILWFQKPYPIGKTLTDNMLSYGVGAWNEEALKKYNKVTNKNREQSNIFKVKNHVLDKQKVHPTQKPLELLMLLIELVTLEDAKILDPFAGSGSTLIASMLTHRESVGIEMSEEYCRGFSEFLTKTEEYNFMCIEEETHEQ